MISEYNYLKHFEERLKNLFEKIKNIKKIFKMFVSLQYAVVAWYQLFNYKVI